MPMSVPAYPESDAFAYGDAFSRNIGLVQPQEQERLRRTTVAVAGLGGVGGIHLVTHARMGIGRFCLADFDHFELHNFNRQSGALMSTLGQPKAATMAAVARDINPEVAITLFDKGVQADSVEAFVRAADVILDGLDFFAVDARALLYSTARRFGVPVIAAGPLGCSAAMLIFTPDGMSWHDYFAMDLARNEIDRYVLFAVGNAPAATFRPYMDSRYVRLDARRGPSLALATQLCAGVVAAESLKLILGRGRVYAAPYYHQFDAYRCRYVRGKLRWGNRGPLQRLRGQWIRQQYLAGNGLTLTAVRERLRALLTLAPSGACATAASQACTLSPRAISSADRSAQHRILGGDK